MSGVDSVDTTSLLGTLPVTAAAVVLVLAITFAVAVRLGKHAVIDVAWGLGFVAVTVTAFVRATGDGTRAAVVLTMVTLWGLRLAGHIANRSRGHGEDPRYEQILARAPGSRDLYALQRVYLPQGLLIWFISLPAQTAMFGTEGPGALLVVGLVVWAVGLFFETVGDWQLHRFRTSSDSQGKVLDTGLWRYTRHPNYFGDATAWWGVFLVAADAGPVGWLTFPAPLVMTWLLARGTGKPLLEKDIAERRPEYAEYVRRTSGFVPLPPRPPRDGS